MISPESALEALIEFAVGDMDHGGVAIGTGVGHGGSGQAIEHGADFQVGEVIFAIVGMSAGCLGDMNGALPVGDGALAEVVEDVSQRFANILVGVGGWNGGDQEGIAAEWLDAKAQGVEMADFAAEETGFFQAEIEGNGEEELLA